MVTALALPLGSPQLALASEGSTDTETSVPATAPIPTRAPKRVLFFPGVTYNSDDGVGVGFIASFRWPRRTEEEERPYEWDLSGVGLAYFNPEPNAWGASAKASWFPDPGGDREVQFIIHSVGWNQAWYSGLGPNVATEAWRRGEEDEVTDPWHRYGIYDLTLGARLSQRLEGDPNVETGLRLDYDHLNIREGTLLHQQRNAGFVLAPEDALSATGEVALSLHSAEPRHDPKAGGVVRGGLYLTGGSAGVHAKTLLDVRGYTQLGPSAPVVLAGTVLAQMQWGTIPFYELSVLGDSAAKPRLSTGSRGLRGLRRGQLRGPLNLLMMSELRFRLPPISVKNLTARVQLVLCADAVWVDTYQSIGERLLPHPGFGGGLRVVLNEQLVVHVDVATAPHSTIITSGREHWGVRGYASIDHMF